MKNQELQTRLKQLPDDSEIILDLDFYCGETAEIDTVYHDKKLNKVEIVAKGQYTKADPLFLMPRAKLTPAQEARTDRLVSGLFVLVLLIAMILMWCMIKY
jgi:hypothetical protein